MCVYNFPNDVTHPTSLPHTPHMEKMHLSLCLSCFTAHLLLSPLFLCSIVLRTHWLCALGSLLVGFGEPYGKECNASTFPIILFPIILSFPLYFIHFILSHYALYTFSITLSLDLYFFQSRRFIGDQRNSSGDLAMCVFCMPGTSL